MLHEFCLKTVRQYDEQTLQVEVEFLPALLLNRIYK